MSINVLYPVATQLETTNHLVTQHNALIRAKYDYKQREIKVSRLITSKINPFMEYTPGTGLVVEIDPAEVKAIFAEPGKSYHSTWRDFRETIASLNRNPIKIKTPNFDGDIYWTQSCMRNNITGRYEVKLTEDILPFLVALKQGNFTSVPLAIYTQIKGKYLYRLYEVLCSYRNMRGGIVKYTSWKVLATEIGWQEKSYGHFKRRVLLKAQKEFRLLSDLSFEFEEKKRFGSKSVEGLLIKITMRKPKSNPEPLSLKPAENKTSAIAKIRHQLAAWAVSDFMIEKLLEDPFDIIADEGKRETTRKAYPDKLAYLKEKIAYVLNANGVESQARYLTRAIQLDYTSKQQKENKAATEKKTFQERQTAKIAGLEAEIVTVRKKAYSVRSDLADQLLTMNPELLLPVFETARARLKRNLDHSEMEKQFLQKGSFRSKVIALIQEKFPDKFEHFIQAEEKQVRALKQEIRELRNYCFDIGKA